MEHKTKMYACFVFFPDGSVKRWKYVTNLATFGAFLSKSHPTWKYFNVYDKGTKAYLKRFYPGHLIPKVLAAFLFALACLKAQSKTFNNLPLSHTYENTFNKTTFNKATFINGFNNSATIPTPEVKGGVSC